jgi:hypothetical protein
MNTDTDLHCDLSPLKWALSASLCCTFLNHHLVHFPPLPILWLVCDEPLCLVYILFVTLSPTPNSTTKLQFSSSLSPTSRPSVFSHGRSHEAFSSIACDAPAAAAAAPRPLRLLVLQHMPQRAVHAAPLARLGAIGV